MLRGCVRLSVVCKEVIKVVYDVWTDFNSLAYHIPASSVDYQKNSFLYRTDRDWNCRLSVQYSLNNSGVMYLYELYLRYSTGCGERESRPFREEPETFISILISTTPVHLEPFVMHSALPERPQPLVRSLQLVEVWQYLEERKKDYVLWLNDAS